MLGVIIVAYKNPERTVEYVNTQLRNLLPEHIVVIVNNSSTMAECQAMANAINGVACRPDDLVGKHGAYVVQSAENLGFAKGNNLGVSVLMRNNPCDYLLFSNDDIIIEEKTDLTAMIDLLERDNSIGAIGPDIVGIDGRHQSPHYHVVSPYRQIGWMLFPFLRGRKKKSVGHPATPGIDPAPSAGLCYWVSGAFFMMRSDVFLSVGGFDPDTFLYGEEPILAERLKLKGMTMYFYPKLRVIHLEGGTTKQVVGNNKIKNLIVESNCVYYLKYLRAPKMVVYLYKWLNSSRMMARVR